jgi:antitoxin component of MazEF toxin-antitoxin module
MTLVVKSSNEDVIALPAWLMKMLNLQEGDQIKTVVEGQTLRLARLDQFLALRGVLRDDDAFDEAMELLEKGWQSWTTPDSV